MYFQIGGSSSGLILYFSDNQLEKWIWRKHFFVAFVAQDFKSFLVLFQSKEPMIHHLYPAMLSLLYELQRKFIRKSKLNAEDLSQNFMQRTLPPPSNLHSKD